MSRAAAERFCCDGKCNLSQGHGGFPAVDPSIARPPVERRRPGLWRRIVRWVHGAMIRADIAATEQWIADCEHDGILDSRSLTECRKRVQCLRVDLAILSTQEPPK